MKTLHILFDSRKALAHLSLYFLAFLLFCSCGDYLDETPKGTLIPKTVNDFGMMLDDATFGSTSYLAGAENLTLMMTDDVQLTEKRMPDYQTWAVNGYEWADYLYGANEDDRDYNGFYKAIYLCNYIIANVGEAKEGTQFTRASVEGSARLTRAYSYLTLVNMYAKQYDAATASTDLGVAMPLEADINESLSRSTVQEVYDQIIDDITKAENLLPETQEYPWRGTKAGAAGLMARVYLYMGNYEKCLEYARKARAMVNEPADYNQYSVTYINPDYGITGWPGFYIYDYQYPDVVYYKSIYRTPTTRCDYILSDELAALYDDTDLRKQLFFTTCSSYGMTPGAEPLHVAGYYWPQNHGIDVGDIYIMDAEAAVRTGNTSEALECLNALGRKRHATGTYQDVTETDPDKLLSLILDERRRELFICGTRWYDLKRLNKDPRFAKTITHKLGDETWTLTPNDPHYVLPIPLKVININSNLEQNPRE